MYSQYTALRLSEPVEAAYMDCVDRLVENIASHFRTGRGWTTAKWEAEKLQELGALTRENAQIINAAMKGVPGEILAAVSESSRIALEELDEMIREAIEKGAIMGAPTDSVKTLVYDLAQQAVDQANLVNTVMLDSGQQAYLRVISDTVQWEKLYMSNAQLAAAQEIMNASTMSVVTGAQAREKALRQAIGKMAENGIHGFVDRGGHTWSPEAYINMDIRTTAHNAAVQSVKARQADYGSDIFQVSSHPGARPLCFPYQNRFYSWNNRGGTFVDGYGQEHMFEPLNRTSYGEPAGLFGINCGHFPLAQIPYVTVPTPPNDVEYEENRRLYQQSQHQRAMERSVRETKRKAAAFNAAGDTEAFERTAVAVKRRTAAYREFCDAHGLVERTDRLQVYTYNRSVSSKATWAARRAANK